MRFFLLTLVVFFFLPSGVSAYTSDDFVITVNTSLAGSASTTFILPTTGSGYNFTVDWGDGSTTTHSGSPGNVSHIYATSGVKMIVVTHNTPNGFPRIYFNGTGDRRKLLTIEQWGTNQWTSMLHAFRNCNDLTIPAVDAPDLSNVTNMGFMFAGANAMNSDLSAWDVSNVTAMNSLFSGTFSAFNQPLDSWDVSRVVNMNFMFLGAASFNRPLSSWNVASATSMTGMFQNAVNFNQDISAWNVSGLTVAEDVFFNSDLSMENYNNLLNGWSQLVLQPGIDLGTVGPNGNPTPYLASVQPARDILTNAPNNWTIIDGGPAYTLTYSAGTNATLIGDGAQTVIGGDDGTEVMVVPDEGYSFIKWSDESTSNPRIDLAVATDISVTAIIEKDESSTQSTQTRGRSTPKDTSDAIDASSHSTDNTSLFEDGVALVNILSLSPEDLESLPSEDKRKVVALLQELIATLLLILQKLGA